MINTYEMMFILRPDLNQEQINKQLRKYRDFLKDIGAEKVSLELWGSSNKRRLAYPIDKFQDGVYVLCYYTGDGTQVALVEKDMRLSEQVLRYLTIKLDSNFEFEEKDIPEAQQTGATSPIELPTPSGISLKTEPETEATEPEVVETESSEEASSSDDVVAVEE